MLQRAKLWKEQFRNTLTPAARTQASQWEDVALLTDAKFLDNVFVALGIVGLKVVKQATAFAHQHEKPAPRGMVLLMSFEVTGQTADPLAEDSNLDLGAAGIALMGAITLDNILLLLFR
jgi:hypothetical protein